MRSLNLNQIHVACVAAILFLGVTFPTSSAYGQCCCCCCCCDSGCCEDCCESDEFGGVEGFALPTDRSMWIPRPVSLSMLKGKGAFLYFFDEEAIELATRWVDLREVADEYADWPVMFIAVNSGNSRRTVQSYARRNQVAWPLIIDEERSFESRAQIGEIDSGNYEQIVIIDVEGEPIKIDERGNVREAVERALEGASWLVEPELIPSSLQSAWRAVEFPDYTIAERELRQALKSSDEEVLRAARLLNDSIWQQMTKESENGRQLAMKGDFFMAYEALQEVRTNYAPYPLPQQLIDQISWLKARPEVKDEFTARQALAKAKGLLKTERAALINQARAQLRSIATRYPKTLAARDAIDLFQNTEASIESRSSGSGGSGGDDDDGGCCF